MSEEEIWIDMDIPGYQISNTALIRRISLKVDHERYPPGVRLLPFRSSQRKKGSWYRLSVDGSQKVFKVSKLMEKYFGAKFEDNERWLERTRREINKYNDKLRKRKIVLKLTSTTVSSQKMNTDFCPYNNGLIKGPAAKADPILGFSVEWNFDGVQNK